MSQAAATGGTSSVVRIYSIQGAAIESAGLAVRTGDGTATMSRLQAYLALEREMLRLDAAGDELAEALRDAMDPTIPSKLY